MAFGFVLLYHITLLPCELLLETVGGFEGRDFVSGDDEGSVLVDVAGSLLHAGLYDEAAESAQ